MTNLNFKDISAELQTFCKVPFPRPEQSETLRVKFTENPEFDNDQFLSKRDHLDKRKHVYANVWERSLDPRGTGGDKGPSPDTWTINWRQWPPDIPHIPAGLKIPVEFVPNEYLGLMEAFPISSGSPEFYKHVEGILNTSQTTSVTVDPPALLFLRSQVGQFYSVKLRLKNIDSIPRKITIFPPRNTCFQIIWGSNKPSLVPGLTIPITVHFRPDSNESVNEVLFIAVEGDGALTVPLVSATIPPPILELDEWDCGCSVISTSRIEHFEIKNVGSKGRFWFLTEDEFRFEYLSLQNKNQHKSRSITSDNQPRSSNPNSNNGMENTFQQKPNTVYTTSFKVSPSCCKLQRNQKVKIKVKYTPSSAGLQYEKLAMMCDNGEVRWIAVKGMGIDIRSKRLLELQAEPSWTAPPVDIQSDFSCRYSIDMGDLLPGDRGTMEFKAINRSCIPLYFFWSVRPLQMESNDEPTGNISFQKFLEGTTQPLEWDDYSNHWHDGIKSKETEVDVKIRPSQGILRQRQEMGFTLSAPCPKNNLGYYGCVISLFVEQVDDESMSIITPFVKKLEAKGKNDVPIHLDDLRRTMPPKGHPMSRHKDKVHSKRRNHNSFVGGDTGDCSGFYDPRKSDDMSTSDSEVEVFTIKHGHHGHDKLQPLKTHHRRDHDHTEGDPMKNRHHHASVDISNPEAIETEESTQPIPLNDQTRGSLDHNKLKKLSGSHTNPVVIKKTGGEYMSGVDTAAGLHYVRKSDQIRTSRGSRMSARHSPTMDELQRYTEMANVPKPTAWLKNAALQPIAEVEVWLRSVPLNIQFNPPFIVATGSTMSRAERTISAFNGSSWAVEVNWLEMIDVVGCVSCEPSKVLLQPQEKYEFKITILFERNGKVCQDLKGFMIVSNSTMKTPCSIPCCIDTTGPFIITLTPILNFGVMKMSTEKMKTLAIKNTGDYPAQWVASVNAEGLVDEQNRKISPFNQNLEGLRLLRVWPTWGILEPQETLGINVYFSAEIIGEIAASVKIMVEGIPESTLYIPICAEVQSPFLVLEEGEINISREVMAANKVQDTTITLINPTGFQINFAWQSSLIGRQSQLVTAEFSPPTGFVPPRGTMDCILTVSARIETALRNVYALCIVDTMKEPLILRISSN